MFPLTFTRLRFECLVQTPLRLGGWRAGSNLRGALVDVMRRATCAYSVPSVPGQKVAVDPAHTAQCPVCWLVAAHEKPGVERRGYVLTPPEGVPSVLMPAERFAFHLTLLGEAQHFLPYFVLAVPEMGLGGVGTGRGRFHLRRVVAEFPGGREEEVLAEGTQALRLPEQVVTHADLLNLAEKFSRRWREAGVASLELKFLTPLRLIWNESLVKAPDFSILFARLLERVDELAMQFSGGERRPLEERAHLQNLAREVRLIENHTLWVEVSSGSSRTGSKTWISGLVGSARYAAPVPVWKELLPWLLWGEAMQVGKDTVKGNGAFRMVIF